MGETKLKSATLLFLVMVVTWICVAEASGSHGDTDLPPPPRIPGMVEQYYVGHKAREESLRQLDAMVSLVTTQKNQNERMRKVLQEQDKALHEVMNNNKQMHQELQEQDKVLDENMQILQEMRSNLRKTQYDYEHPRQEAAGQAHTMDEGTGPTYKLRFHGSMKARIYTNKSLLDQRDGRIEIAIYRDGQIITSGLLSSVRVEIVALESNHSCKGSWTKEDFHRQIQMRRRGQGSVLEGDRTVKLVNGKASLGKVWFSEGSSGTRSRELVLAARIDRSEKIGVRVEEAFMEPAITVLVERSEANEKSGLPVLNDKVHRLKEIAKGGVYARRLEQNGISTVQDFLKALNKDEDKLRQILEMKSEKSWKVLVGHARECDLTKEHKLKQYVVPGENVTLFFNCIHDNVGAEFNHRYIAKEKFDPKQKALVDSLKEQVYNKLDGVGFNYVMIDNRPQKFSGNDNAAGSSSIPMLGASPRNTSDHHAHAVPHAVEKLDPSGIGPVPEPDLPLVGANCNAAGASASEPSPPDHHTHQNQVEKLGPSGISPVPEPDLPLGGANCNAAGPSASEPSPDHHYTHQNQGVADNSIPEGDDTRPDTATTDVGWKAYWAEILADTQDWLIHTPPGPNSDLYTPGGQFQNFLSTAPSGSETPRSMNLYNSTFPGPDSDLFTPGDQFLTFPPPEDPTAPSGSGGGN